MISHSHLSIRNLLINRTFYLKSAKFLITRKVQIKFLKKWKRIKDLFIFLSCVYTYDVHSVINFQRICQTTWLLETICTSGNVFQTRFKQIKQTCHFNSGEASSIFSKEGKVFDSISLFCQLTYSENRGFFCSSLSVDWLHRCSRPKSRLNQLS